MLQRDTIKSENISPAPKVVIANIKDSYAAKADEDGFGFTSSWADAAEQADVLFLLVPDQVLPNTPPRASMLTPTGSTEAVQRVARAYIEEDLLCRCRQRIQCLLQVPQHRILK